MTTQVKFAIGASVLVSAVAYLMFTGVQQTSVYYLTIQEFLTKKEALVGEGVRVAGRVEMGSVKKSMTEKGAELNFRVGDFKTGDEVGPSVPVHFVGIVPDMFKDEGGSDVIIEGKYRDGTLWAQAVLTSCPSKYEAKAQ